MSEDDIDPKDLVVEAETLITAAVYSTDDHRHDQLLAWAREMIAPLVVANYPEALWVECTLALDHDERITEEEREKRYGEAVRKAAAAGCISAKFALACILDEPATRAEAARLFAEAAIAGHAQAKWCHGLVD